MTADTGIPGLGGYWQPVDLEAVRALIDAATPGPWREWPVDPIPLRQVGPSEAGPVALVYERSERPADAAFIAAARTLVPQMADEIERLRDLVEAESREKFRQGVELRAEVERLRPVVEAAQAWYAGSTLSEPHESALGAAVEAYEAAGGEVR